MVLICSRTCSSPSSTIFCGVSARSNNFRVALLTPASVAWAESTTATSSVYGLRCSSSPLGSGLALLKRAKASRTSACVQGVIEALGAALAAGARRNLDAAVFRGFAAARPEDFLAGFLAGFLAHFLAVLFGPEDGPRIIFDMIGIY